MTHDQVVAPGRDSGKSLWRWVGAALGALATAVGLITGGIAIVDFLERDQGPAVFEGSLDTSAGMRAFLRFADEHDGEVVRLETQCLYNDGPRVCVDQADPFDPMAVVLDLNEDEGCPPDREGPCDGSVALHFFRKDLAEAQIDNGSYGAGSIVVRGYFTLSKRGNLGTQLPETATTIYLTAVPAHEVRRE